MQAAEDALHRVFLTKTPDHLIQLPTSTFASGSGNVFQDGVASQDYVAPELAMPEILYASSGRSGVAPSSAPRTPRRGIQDD